MKKYIIFILFLIPLLLTSCSRDIPVSSSEETKNSEGSVALKIDKINAPAAVSTISATLTRQGYETIYKSLNIRTDSTADLTLGNVPIGTWKLQVDAKGPDGAVLYTGQSEVIVNPGATTAVSLRLDPATGTGSIQISVTWGMSLWTDYLQNPIFKSSDSPTLPISVAGCKVIYDDGKYKMWYLNTYNAGRGNVGYAESSDGIRWTSPVSGAVITSGPSGAWDDYTVGAGPVLKENGIYKMFYNGWRSQYDNWYIGYAISQDGISWQKSPNPIISGSGIEAQPGATDIVKSGSTYYLYYTSRDLSMGNYRINVATSTDGLTFTKYSGNPLLTVSQPWEASGIYYPSVILDNGVFKMIYQAINGSALGMATSADGLHWTKDPFNPVFRNADAKAPGTSSVNYPYLRKFGTQYRLYYSAGGSSGGYYIGLATRNSL